jgi:hypothetical protein
MVPLWWTRLDEVACGWAWAVKIGDCLIPKQEAVGSSPITRSHSSLVECAHHGVFAVHS